MSLQEVARRHLLELRQGADGEARQGNVERVSLEVSLAGRKELVTLALREDGSLMISSSDGETEGEAVQAALALLAGEELAGTNEAARAPVVMDARPAADLSVAEGLEDLVLAVLRSGIDHAYGSAALNEAIDALFEAVGAPAPLGLTRAIGRLHTFLATKETEHAARLLDGFLQTASALRDDGESSPRLCAWLGHPRRSRHQAPVLPMVDETLIEIARERVAGRRRGEVRRSYLAHPRSGRIYREDTLRSGKGSLGPCPRTIVAGFAESEKGPKPNRLRLLQYTVSPVVSREHWADLTELSVRIKTLLPRYRDAYKNFPALAEPFAMVRAKADIEAGVARDDVGDELRLQLPMGVGERIAALDQARVSWIAGRVEDVKGELVLRPLSLGLVDGIVRLI